MRKTVILPLMMVSVKRKMELNEKLEYGTGDKLEDAKKVGWGMVGFLEYMRPHAFEPNYAGAKGLMVDDKNYSTP